MEDFDPPQYIRIRCKICGEPAVRSTFIPNTWVHEGSVFAVKEDGIEDMEPHKPVLDVIDIPWGDDGTERKLPLFGRP